MTWRSDSTSSDRNDGAQMMSEVDQLELVLRRKMQANDGSVRSANPHELAARYIEQYGKMAQVAETLDDALAIANRAVTKEDLICITGSFYLVGEAKRNFAAKAALAKAQG